MHNPYATSPAGEGGQQATAFASPESSRTTDYTDAIGPNSDYYLPRFEDFDQRGPRLSWHWPAFFATSSWFVYRKLYLIGILNFFYPFILFLGSGFLIATRVVAPSTGGLLILALSPVPWLLLTLFANRIYWRRISGVIEDTPAYENPARRSSELSRAGGVARGPMTAMVIFTVLYVVMLIGVNAAIAIPAYQDYTIRSQVFEGLKLAAPVKARVEEHWAKHRQWPEQADIKGEIPHGKHVESVTVESGSIVITYSERANIKLRGLRLILAPGADEKGDVFWACGDAALPENAQPGSGPHGSDLPAKYMPAMCRAS